ncbi:MarR family winged helix-turn-helix transcriptional regulator [Variovorax sp. J22P240]|uniref:MarR family winged helix-turn-helix transcriptional regulator n=1 Tax=unclassified Variovorax TaxID=663243 RepID=UPI0025756544|nr:MULTISPECIES: MarR family winged helix-turn-helix transcriptional regulator [unclassified Variovorax]MDL9999770.1 MarR family winged helix-turn-helix transcriptional regulator [Variovorax sp. J22P240]MDM0049194.1 MarR family winged helix-turn-helix transcriptional regulator [Variovorax sp. J22R115]
MAVSRKKSIPTAPTQAPRSDRLDTRVLEALVGYNARRAWLIVSQVFAERMAAYGLKQVDFSVLSLLAHNPGATSRQLCSTLDILPPNLVSLIAGMDSRGLIERRPHPHDGRAIGLYLTPAGEELVREAEQTVVQLEADASARLTSRERETLIRLLQKIYH